MKTRSHTLLPLAALAGVAIFTAPAKAQTIITPTIDVPLTTTTAVGGFEIGKTVDSSGLSGGGTSGNVLTETNNNGATQWLNGGAAIGSEVVTFDLGGTYDVDSVHLWNWVYTNTTSTIWGVGSVDISFSTDGTNFLNTETVSFVADPTSGGLGPSVAQTQTFSTKTGVTHIQLDNFTALDSGNRVGFGEIRFGGTGATPADPILSQDLVNGDPDLDFGTVASGAPFSDSRTVRFVNDGPTNAIEISTATVSGDAAYSLSDIAINGSGGISLPQSLAVGDYIEFTVAASLAANASGVTGSLAIDTDADDQDQNLPITGTFTDPPTIINPFSVTSPAGAIYTVDAGLIDGVGLSGGGTSGDILSETHDYGVGANSWHSNNGNGPTTVMTFKLGELGEAFTVDSVHIWNWVATNGVVNRSVKTVDISFSTDGGVSYNPIHDIDNLGEFANAISTTPTTVDPAVVPVSTIAFPAAVSGVTHIRLTDFQNHGDPYTAMSEIRFGGTPSTGGGNDFSDWIAGFPGAAGDITFDGDPDDDGIASGLENFFGTNPGEFSTGVVSGVVDTGAGTFTFTHPQSDTPADDVSAPAYTWSTDLATFTADGAANGGSTVTFSAAIDDPIANTTTVTATVTGTPISKLFVRVGVSQVLP